MTSVPVSILELDAGSLYDQLRSHAKAAFDADLRPVSFAHGPWCRPSNIVVDSLEDPRMQRALRGIHLVVFIDRSWKMAQALPHDIWIPLYPSFVCLDEQGKGHGRR